MDQYIEFISNHYLLSLAFVVVLYLLLQDLIESSLNKFTGLSPALAVTKMNNDDALVVDVREPNEYVKSHIEGSINIPLNKFSDQIDSITQHKTHPVIIVCQTGTRSISACKTLTKNHFEHVFNIIGGMQSWEENKLPIKTSK